MGGAELNMDRRGDDYLWDGKGEDAEIERLEEVLRPLGYRPPAATPAPPSTGSLHTDGRRRRTMTVALLATAAALAIAASLFVFRPAPEPPPGPSLACRSATQSFECRAGERVRASEGPLTLDLRGIGYVVAEQDAE